MHYIEKRPASLVDLMQCTLQRSPEDTSSGGGDSQEGQRWSSCAPAAQAIKSKNDRREFFFLKISFWELFLLGNIKRNPLTPLTKRRIRGTIITQTVGREKNRIESLLKGKNNNG